MDTRCPRYHAAGPLPGGTSAGNGQTCPPDTLGNICDRFLPRNNPEAHGEQKGQTGAQPHNAASPCSHEEAGEAAAVHAVAAERGRPGAGAGAAACRLRQVQRQKQAAAAAGRRGQADAVTAARGVGRRGRFLTPAALCLDVGGRCGRTDTCKNASASRLAPVCFAACPVKHDKSPRSTAPDTEQSFQKVRDVSLVFNITMVDSFPPNPIRH